MNYFIDTEFAEDGRLLDLISIGIVAEDGREFIAYNMNVDMRNANDWVKKNVLIYLPGIDSFSDGTVEFDGDIYGNPNHEWYPSLVIASKIIKFVGDDDDPVFWADWGAYDWVAFCRLFGNLDDLPDGWPMFVRDFQQLWYLCGKPDVTVPQRTEHDVLQDALYLRDKYDWIMDQYKITVEHVDA